MKKRIKKLWIAALRSKKYKQAKGVLCRVESDGDKSYCCLGVLEDVVRRMQGVKSPRVERIKRTVLTAATMRKAGLNDRNPDLGECSAAELNDNGKSFAYIAKEIERYL